LLSISYGPLIPCHAENSGWKYLYKYPQATYPYLDLIQTNKRRGRNDMEYELLETGVFEKDRYFDVFVEYAKQGTEDLLIRISVVNRGPEPATIHLLPSLWFRNTWTWWPGTPKPSLRQLAGKNGWKVVSASHAQLGERYLYCEGDVPLLFTENETNNERIFGTPNSSLYVKDGINNYVVAGSHNAVNPEQVGTKSAAHYRLTMGAAETSTIRLRLTDLAPDAIGDPFNSFDATLQTRLSDADDFYKSITPERAGEDEALVMRQAFAGMLWTKQYFFFDVHKWLAEHSIDPLKPGGRSIRNRDWFHMVNRHVISMPDKWEYPWYAAWDLAFHTIALAPVDIDFAKEQLDLMLQEFYLHPTGQIPAYEWNFSDVNPPVHAWASIFLYRTEQLLHGKGDIEFLKRSFPKLMLNFSWWVNRKDRFGNNLFEGGFLGLDNIGVFDRSSPLPTGGSLQQADGTAWVCMFAQNMLEMAIELTAHNPSYEDMAVKFAEHFMWIAVAMNQMGPEGMWDEEDGFYYDMLRLPDGSTKRLKVRSMVGLLPLCATTIIEQWQRERVPRVSSVLQERMRRMPELRDGIHTSEPGHRGFAGRDIAALVNEDRLRRILTRVLDEKEFLSPYGVRALSRYHEDHPYIVHVDGQEYKVKYLPAESDNGMFGGNSNWRGPVWMPMNVLLIRALLQFYLYYGNNFKIECPTGSGNLMNLFEVAREISDRLTGMFLRDKSGRRPVFGGTEKFQTDPQWKDYVLFYEYFHGDNGAGLGASHQTGWTGLVAMLIEVFGRVDPQQLLNEGKPGSHKSEPRAEPVHAVYA
jgi:hypothetical protein